MRDVILDANVIGAIAAARDESRASALAALRVVRKKGGRLVVTPTIMGELAATYTHEATFEKVLAALQQICDGYLRASTEQILKIEAAEDEPYSIITARQAKLGSFDAMRETVQEEEVQRFFREGGYGYDQMRHLLEAFDPLAKKLRPHISSFRAFVEECRLSALKRLVATAKETQFLDEREYDLEALWTRGAGWRFLTVIKLANEYRRLLKIQHKGEGCMTDLRVVIEAAYSHEVRTRDKELAFCGALANQLVRTPAIKLWENPSSGSPGGSQRKRTAARSRALPTATAKSKARARASSVI